MPDPPLSDIDFKNKWLWSGQLLKLARKSKSWDSGECHYVGRKFIEKILIFYTIPFNANFQESSQPKTETSTPASSTPTSQPSSQPSGGSSSASQPSSNPFAGKRSKAYKGGVKLSDFEIISKPSQISWKISHLLHKPILLWKESIP